MKKFRLYYDPDRELMWLQELMNQGWALTHFAMGVYTFEPCTPGEYIYQIDILKDVSDFDNYKTFMEDSGVEVICRWVRWVFVRKSAEDGPFTLYSDPESRIRYYRTIRNFFLPIAVLELMCFCIELFAAISSGNPVMGLLVILIAAVAVIFLRMVWRCSWRIEELQKQHSF